MTIQRSGHYFHHTYWLQLAMLAAMALSVTGCGTQLRPDPGTGDSSIAGEWLLQSPQRTTLADNMRAVMEQARAKQDKRDRQELRRRPEPEIRFTPPDADGDVPDHSAPGHGPRRLKWETREQIEQQEALLNAVLPSDRLQIVQSVSRTEFIPSTGGRRRFDKGVESTLVTHYATLRVESGWQANVFVVHSRDSQQRIDIVERYQRLGDRLQLQVQVSIPDAKEQRFAADYTLAQR